MTPTQYTQIKILASGRVAYVAGGKAELETCGWAVEVLTASLYPAEADWYPDSPADVYTTVDCGAPVFAPDGDPDYTRCSHGHVRMTYGSPRQQAAERMEALVESTASRDPRIAARLDAGETWEQVVA